MRCIADTTARPTFGPGVGASSARLREFGAGDIPIISEIVAEGLHEHYDPSLYVSLSQQWPQGFLIAADALGRPIGFLLGVSQIEHEARILMFAVDRDHRIQGVGSTLMKAFLERCRDRRYTRVTLEVRVSNATAIRFYTGFRFSVIELLRGYYSDGENGYQMARPVD
ncbi:MAG: GNAT family N-acetyltransferase [Thermoplasmata archaeon]